MTAYIEFPVDNRCRYWGWLGRCAEFAAPFLRCGGDAGAGKANAVENPQIAVPVLAPPVLSCQHHHHQNKRSKIKGTSTIKVSVRQGRETWRARVEVCGRVACRHFFGLVEGTPGRRAASIQVGLVSVQGRTTIPWRAVDRWQAGCTSQCLGWFSRLPKK